MLKVLDHGWHLPTMKFHFHFLHLLTDFCFSKTCVQRLLQIHGYKHTLDGMCITFKPTRHGKIRVERAWLWTWWTDQINPVAMSDMQKVEVSTHSQNKQPQSIQSLLHQNLFIETLAAPHQDARGGKRNCPEKERTQLLLLMEPLSSHMLVCSPTVKSFVVMKLLPSLQ